MVDQWVIGLPLVVAVISAAFAAMVFGRLLKWRAFVLFPWSVGLAMVAFVSVLEFTAHPRIGGADEGLYRTYLAAYPILVAVLGLGTVYLMDRRWGNAFLLYILVLSGVLLFFAATAPVDPPPTLWPSWLLGFVALPDGVGFPALVLILSGAVALVGGALYSWAKTHEQYGLYIAAGAGLMLTAGIVARFAPVLVFHAYYALLTIGIVVMSLGFLEAPRLPWPPRPRTVTLSVD